MMVTMMMVAMTSGSDVLHKSLNEIIYITQRPFLHLRTFQPQGFSMYVVGAVGFGQKHPLAHNIASSTQPLLINRIDLKCETDFQSSNLNLWKNSEKIQKGILNLASVQVLRNNNNQCFAVSNTSSYI